MGYDWDQFLKLYVHVIDIDFYKEDKDRLVLDKAEQIIEDFFGERFIDLVALPSVIDRSTFWNVYAVYDQKEHPFEAAFIADITRKTFRAFGVKIGE